MTHHYKRHCYRLRDGRAFVESLSLEGEQVAMHTGGRGDRADMLHLLNRWHKANLACGELGANGMIYVYTLETP